MPDDTAVAEPLRRADRAGLVAIVLAGGAAACAVWTATRPHVSRFSRDWLSAALTSRLSGLCAAVFLAASAALVLAGAALWKAGRAGRKRRRGQDGQAMVEFVLVLPVALTIVLVMIQTSLLLGGNLCVHYAAYCAARSAAVQVPLYYGLDEPRNVVDAPQDSLKLEMIRQAAVWAVLPVSCGREGYRAANDGPLRDGLEEFYGAYGEPTPLWVSDQLGRRMQYAQDWTAVQLAPPVSQDEDAPPARWRYEAKEDLRVTVRHALYLSVPYASWVFRTLDTEGGMDLDFAPGQYALRIETVCTLSNEGDQDYVDVEPFDVVP